MTILNSTKSKFLVLIMIISVTIAPLSSSIDVTGDDEPIIDYSLLEDIIEQKLVPADGECFKVLIVQVNFLDYPVSQRYTKDELNEYLNGTVVPYVDVASYGNACVSHYACDSVVWLHQYFQWQKLFRLFPSLLVQNLPDLALTPRRFRKFLRKGLF